MAVAYRFTKDEMSVDQSLGYPRAYAKLCKDTSLYPYNHGPPFTFSPFSLQPQEASRAKELDEMFPIIGPQAKPTAKPGRYVTLLWKQLNHLGNAGFDPAMFRVDPYGNVLYFHADSASPLAWDFDHWFPCSRGGLTVPRNLRVLQWQVCKRKDNQLEFLVPWWDLQLGISINQFLSLFAASNSDFRHRAFSLLFSGGKNEELNDLQTVDSHNFPQPFMELKDQIGLAPAAIVQTRRESSDPSTLRSLDVSRQSRPSTPMIAPSRRVKNGELKENEALDMITNPYQAIVMARDSLKHREETKKMKAEIERLDDEVCEMRVKNEEEKLTIQELELELIKHRRRAEKCRRLAESQSSHKSMIEKMIRNAMHQSVVYKEQVRLNQAATNTLMARLEAQMAICNSAEKELHRRYKIRDDLEKEIRPQLEQARKRPRTEEEEVLTEERGNRTLINLPRLKNKSHICKELGMFLDEETILSEEARALIRERMVEEKTEDDEHLKKLTFAQGTNEEDDIEGTSQFTRGPEVEEDEGSRKSRGKGNVEKWLHMLLEDNAEEMVFADDFGSPQDSKTDEIIRMVNEKFPLKKKKDEIVDIEARKARSISAPRRSVASETDVLVKESSARRSFAGRKESFRSFRSTPSSPSMILRKKPLVTDNDDDEYGGENHHVGNKLLKSSLRSMKKTMKI